MRYVAYFYKLGLSLPPKAEVFQWLKYWNSYLIDIAQGKFYNDHHEKSGVEIK